ncbi:MAG: hypothetical protein ABI446_08540 [Gemmatimonadaceae bacterium]
MLLVIALCTTACRGERGRATQVDTTTGRTSGRVQTRPLAAPADPALVAATAALDSLDKRFMVARASLDSEVLSLRDANRLDSAYAVRYAAFERRRALAGELRTARDRAHRTRDSLAARSAHPSIDKH